MTQRTSDADRQTKTAARKAKRRPNTSGKTKASDRVTWRREADARDITGKLGQRIRGFREALGWSLSAASEATGIPAATLSRIENNKMSPTFAVLLKLMRGLKASWQQLMGSAGESTLAEQVSISNPKHWSILRLQGLAYVVPHSGSELNQTIQPTIFEVRGRSLEEMGGLSGHHGIEFCYVLSGTLILHLAGRDPQELRAGSTALFNSSLPHAYVAKGRRVARVLNVTIRDPLMSGESEVFFREHVANYSRTAS